MRVLPNAVVLASSLPQSRVTSVICRFVDQRVDFFAVLEEKLGEDFSLSAALTDDYDALGASDVLICSLPAADDGDFPSSLKTLQTLVRNPAGIPVVAFLSTDEREVMREAVSAGAFDHFVESGSMEELRLVLRRASRFQELRRELQRLQATPKDNEFSAMVGTDENMRPVFSLASKVAPTDANVLIMGESGTGKELLARSIHLASPRSSEPFVAVACSSLPETLIEAELFGHEKGAFTGANAARVGRFEAAGQGTIFLDEVGDLAPALQVKLLRALEVRTLERRSASAGEAESFLQRVQLRRRRTLQRRCGGAGRGLEEPPSPRIPRPLQRLLEPAIEMCAASARTTEAVPTQFAAWAGAARDR